MSIFKTILTAVILTTLLAGPVWAASDIDAINREAPSEADSAAVWVSLVYILVGFAAVAFVAFRNSKRTHLD